MWKYRLLLVPVQIIEIVISKNKVILSKAATAPFDALRLLRVTVAAASKYEFIREKYNTIF